MRVIAAMSGGVDSAVAAALAVDAGHEVTGVHLALSPDRQTLRSGARGCCSVEDAHDARRVADELGIPFYVWDLADRFREDVVDDFVAEYAAGRTPNPCLRCNEKIKFSAVLDRARALGFDAVATGHHARIVDGRVARGADRAKDQSYVVHMLDGATLGRVRFPVGALTKDEVRRRAGALGLRTATKPDSQDVCFITTGGGRAEFLERRVPFTPATVVATDGAVVGHVDALELVTVGQRRGLTGGGSARLYVTSVDRATATITVGSFGDMLTDRLAVEGLRWVDGPVDGDVLVQTSAHGRPQPAVLQGDVVVWREPQRPVAPGQSVVCYDRSDTFVVAGGTAA
jgi:tRNA-uridine 2-sulfurtransferase